MGAGRREMKMLRRDMQIVFQDPYTSLNPRMTIDDTTAFNMVVHGYLVERIQGQGLGGDGPGGPCLGSMYARRYPHELSGGQRQRVNVARALVLNPKLVMLDEPVSSLDKSVQAQVLNLLIDLKDSLNLTYVFISHDLHVVEYICDRVAVMYLGQVVESGPVGGPVRGPAASLHTGASGVRPLRGPQPPDARGPRSAATLPAPSTRRPAVISVRGVLSPWTGVRSRFRN